MQCCGPVKQSRAGLVVQEIISWEVVQNIPYKSSNYEEFTLKLCCVLVWELLWVSAIPSVMTYDILYNFTNNYL